MSRLQECPLDKLRPTQLTVGMKEVKEKKRHLAKLDAGERREFMQDHPMSVSTLSDGVAGEHPDGVPVPVPARCRASGKRKWEAGGRSPRGLHPRAPRGSRPRCARCRTARAGARPSSRGKAVAVGGARDATVSGERSEASAEGGVADAAGGAQVREGHRAAGLAQGGGDAFVHRGRRRLGRRAALDDFEREGLAALGELERDGGGGRRCAMFDGEREVVTVAAEVKVRVAPGVEFGVAAPAV
jgi:Putative ParB-like nuclease